MFRDAADMQAFNSHLLAIHNIVQAQKQKQEQARQLAKENSSLDQLR